MVLGFLKDLVLLSFTIKFVILCNNNGTKYLCCSLSFLQLIINWHFFKLLILGLLIEVFHGLQRQKVDGWDLHNVHLGLAETICAKGVFNSLANP